MPVSSIAAVNEYEAQLLMEMGDYYGAIHTCDRALEVCPAYLAALHTKGRAQLEMGELSMARDTFLGVKEAAAAAGADGDAALQVDDEGLAEDIARAEVLMAEAAKLEAETGGQVLRGELVLPGAKWNKSCYGSRLAAATPGEVNCDTRNRLYLNLLMSKALDVGAAAKPEDYVSDQTTAVYGLLPVRVGCPVSQPLVRQLQCCLSLEPLNKLLGADQEALGAGRSESLRVPTSVCRDGEAPRDAAARAYEAYYGSNLGTLTDLWQPDFVPPIVHYHQLPTGDTQVQTYFVVVCPPEVTGANTQESSVLVAEFGQQLVEDPQLALARLREVTALLLARNRWTPEQIAFSILIQVAEALVKTELKPAADGWYDPTTIVTTAEQMFARQSVQQLVSGLLQCPEAPDVEAWSIALLGAVELLCVRWNIKSSLVPMVQSLLQHCGATVGAQGSGLITPLAALRWYARDPRAIVIAFGDASSEQARMEMLVGIHGVRTSSETAEWVKLLRQQQPDAAAAHDASHKDVSSSERCIWSRADRGLVGAAGQIALKAQGLLQEAAAAGLMNQASPDWDRLVSSPAPAGKRSASEASTEPGAKRKRVVHNVTTDVDLIIIGAGASGVGCGVMAKKFGIEPSRTLIIERGSAVGSTFDQWPAEMRFITPSFNQQAFGFMDLNSVAFDTSPAQLLHEQHPTGPQYAEYLREVSRIHALPVACETDVTAVTPIGAHGHAHGHGHGAEECEHTVGGGFEVSVTQSPNATHKLPAKIRTKFVIWAAGEFQYPRKEGFPGASEHCLHNSRVGSWNELSSSPMAAQPQEDVQAKERVVIGGYESGMDAAVHLANAGVKVTVMASTPFWSMRTLDPSTELAPFTAGRLQAAQAGANPPTLMSHCRVVGVEKEEEAAGGEGPSGYVVVAERTAPTDADEMAMDKDQPTAIVPQSTKDKKTKKDTDKNAATTITAIAPAPEIVRVRTSTKPILATGFHSGVAKTVNHLFEWTEESLCATDSGSTDASGGEDEKRKLQETASASEAHGHGHGHGQPAAAAADAGPQEHSCDGGDDCSHGHGHSKPAPLPLPLPGSVMPTGDAKLTKCDESTIYPGLFLSGPQVRQDDQIFCFVYKYRQRFAVVMNEIATRMGLQTEKVVVECRKQHMFLDDPSCCKATCGSGSC